MAVLHRSYLCYRKRSHRSYYSQHSSVLYFIQGLCPQAVSANAPFHCSRQEFRVSSASAVSSALPFSEHSQGFKAKLPHFPAESSRSKLPTKLRSGLNLRFQWVLKSELKFPPKSQAPQVTYRVSQMPAGQLHSNQAFLHACSRGIPALTTWQVVPEQELLLIPNSGSALPATWVNSKSSCKWELSSFPKQARKGLVSFTHQTSQESVKKGQK